MASKENGVLSQRDSNVALIEPALKRRKVDGAVNDSAPTKISFADVLAQIESEEPDARGSEGGAGQWSRPEMKRVNEKTDTITFQQIDIEQYTNDENQIMLRMYGITEEGNSVLVHISGYLPYFYVAAPRGLQDEDLVPLRHFINQNTEENAIVDIEIVMKKSLWGYRGDHDVPFLKIILSNPKMVPKVRGAFEKGELDYNNLFNKGGFPPATFESNLLFVLRFMVDAKIDPVIQIANMVTRQGEPQPFIRNVFTLNSCAHIAGSQVLSFDNEAKLLEAWSAFVTEVDPDIIIGYNISNFDFPYLIDRADTLKAKKFPHLGRLEGARTYVRNTHFSSKAYGTRDSKETVLEGRLQLDMLQVMQRDYKLRSYSLNSVCAHFLGEQKEDVHHSVITDLQNGTPESRRRLAVYCLKDAYLPHRLMDKLLCLINYTEMARVTGVPFNYLLSRGQSIKVITQLYRKANADNYLIPSTKSEGGDDQYEGATVIEPSRGFYKRPISTLDFSSLYPSIMMAHNLCYTTLLDKDTIERLGLVRDVDYIQTPNKDFFAKTSRRKGLLPTILEDLLGARKRAKADLKKETDPFKRAVLDGRQLALKISANSVYGFTGATVGKLPCLEISSSVTAYGRQMIERTKTVVESHFSLANGRKWDAKVIYGDTDSVMVEFGCDDLETAMELGREAASFVTETEFVKPINLEFEKVYFPYLLINKKRYAGLYWTKPEKYDKMDAKGIETVRRDNCRLVSTVIETCLQKLLIDKDVDAAEKLVHILQFLSTLVDVKFSYVKRMISDLLQNKIDMSQLVITKALSKENYDGKQAHDELAKRMRARDAGSAPALGDRVPYVIIKGAKSAAAYEKAEDPIYVLENNLPIDTRYYLDNQLSKPLERIFEPILGDKVSKLLNGDHTRTVQIATPSTGGLMKFAVKTATCLGCKTALKPNNSRPNGAVCNNCRPRLGELYQKHVYSSQFKSLRVF
ncbi:DNA-directed DNA polymerase delta [Serendipita sp. 411]|nr:DNA-directed DNA polymerase delta [Serendipita sp. 411]